MGWTSLFGGGDSNWNLFDGGVFGGSDGNWGGGFDWGSLWGDIGQGVVDGVDWGSIFGGDSGGGSSGGSNWLSNLFGGGSGGSGGGMGNLFGALLSGLGGAAQSFLDEDALKEAGKQQRENIKEQSKEARKTTDFEAQLMDYYKQKDKARKRYALDSYGQFSLLNKWAPGYAGDRPVEVPTKPVGG